jgi:hypothetical protein
VGHTLCKYAWPLPMVLARPVLVFTTATLEFELNHAADEQSVFVSGRVNVGPAVGTVRIVVALEQTWYAGPITSKLPSVYQSTG